MSLERTVKWIDKTEGRDKFCKAIQYACRLLKHRFEMQGNKNAAKQFDSLFSNMRDARKLFRLFKTVNEAKKIKDIMGQDLTVDSMFNIVVRGLFGVYWFFDNLNILSKIKILSYDSKTMAKWGATFWLLALLVNLIHLIKQLLANFKKANDLKSKYLLGDERMYAASSNNQANQKKKEFSGLMAKRNLIVLNIVKVVGDIVPAGQGSEIFPKVLGFTANDSWCGLGGLVSAIITSYQLYD